MVKYIIYSSLDKHIWRELDSYEALKDGSIVGEINDYEGKFTYHPSTAPAIFETTQEEWDKLDKDNLDKYLIEDGNIIENPEWEPYQSPEYKEGYDQAVLDLIEMGVL